MKTDCQLDYAAILAGRAEVVHLALSFTADSQPGGRATPFAFGIVLDHSGSMTGPPLEHAKAAARLCLQHLRDDDLFSLVVFSNSARTVIPLQRPVDRNKLATLIAEITPASSTNLTAGWMLGRDELAKAPADLPRKLFLLTDGQLNMGIVDPVQVTQIVGRGLEIERIRTSCLGFGDNYTEDLLDKLATASSGALHDAASPEKFPAIFRQELEALLALSVQNLRVRVRRLHYCSGCMLLSDYPVVLLPEGGIEIMVGDLVSAEKRVVVLALEVLPIPAQPDGAPTASLDGEALLDLEFAFDEMRAEGLVSSTTQRTVSVLATQRAEDIRVNEEVVAWVATQQVGRAISASIDERDRGEIDAVKRRIAELRAHLERYGSAEAVQKALQNLADFEAALVNWDPRMRKLSRLSSSRSRKSSSYYEDEERIRAEIEAEELRRQQNNPPPPADPDAPPPTA